MQDRMPRFSNSLIRTLVSHIQKGYWCNFTLHKNPYQGYNNTRMEYMVWMELDGKQGQNESLLVSDFSDSTATLSDWLLKKLLSWTEIGELQYWLWCNLGFRSRNCWNCSYRWIQTRSCNLLMIKYFRSNHRIKSLQNSSVSFTFIIAEVEDVWVLLSIFFKRSLEMSRILEISKCQLWVGKRKAELLSNKDFCDFLQNCKDDSARVKLVKQTQLQNLVRLSEIVEP